MCPASPSRSWSASSESPTSSSWPRTKTRSARARWRSKPCSARSPIPGSIRTAAGTRSSRSWRRSSASTSPRSRWATARTMCWCCWPRRSSRPVSKPCIRSTASPSIRSPSRRPAPTACVVPALPPDSAMPLGHDLAAMARAITRTHARRVRRESQQPHRHLGATQRAAKLHRRACRATWWWRSTRRTSNTPPACRLQNGIDWLGRYPNLVVFRTFSKAYGLAGVRVGYAVSHPSVADMLNRVRQAFNVSVGGPGRCGRRARRSKRTWPPRSTWRLPSVRGSAARLAQPGTRVIPSAGNFLLLHAGADARARFEALAAQGHHRAAGGQLSAARTSAGHAGHRRTERSFPQRLGSLIA